MALIDKLENIGDAIRNKTGKTDLLTLDEMVTEINNIETGGGSGGDVSEYFNTEINTSGSSSYPLWTKTIKKMPDLTIGNNVTSMGYTFYKYLGNEIPNVTILSDNITNFEYCFAFCLNVTTIPEIDTSKGTNFSYMFNGSNNLISVPNIDTSNGTNFSSIFSGCNSLTTIPEIDTSNGKNFSNMFYSTSESKLETIPKLNMSKATNITNFIYTSKGGSQTNFPYLENLGGFENLGEAYSTTASANNNSYTLDILSNIKYADLNKITHDSLMNVINYLYDIKTKGCNTQSLKLGSINLAKLTAEEIAIATNKGWTVS